MGAAGQTKNKIIRAIRDNAESLLTAIALALVLRYFTVEAFKIPTGSMAITLYGSHAWKRCPNCSYRFAVAAPMISQTNQLDLRLAEKLRFRRVTCPSCGAPNVAYLNGLYGNRCEACGAQLPAGEGPVEEMIGFRRNALTGGLLKLVCPLCGYRYHEPVGVKEVTAGDHLFVDKLYYKFIAPRRFDVIVFRFNRQQNYIKRLIAFGGERVDLRGGDVYISKAPGEPLAIARKPPAAQNAVLRLVHDSTRCEKGFNKHPAWEVLPPPGTTRGPVRSGALWRPEAGVLDFNVPDGTAAVRYGRPVTDWSVFNVITGSPTGAQAVADRRLAFSAAPVQSGGNAQLLVLMQDGPYWFSYEFALGGKKRPGGFRIRVRKNGRPWRKVAEAPGTLPLKEESEVVVDNLDDELVLRVGGRVCCRAFVQTGSPDLGFEPGTTNELRIEVRSAQVRLSRIKLWRDIHYRRINRGIRFPFTVPKGDFFALGDNSPNSSDSRYWGRVPRENLVGKAFFIFWPLKPWDFRLRFIR